MALRVCLICIASALLALPTFAQDAGNDDDAGFIDGGAEPDAGAPDAGEPEEGDAGEPGQEDGGLPPGDAGEVDCTPRCEGEVLHFCDDETPVSIDCSETGATCGELSAEWGADCLLPEGAACDPSYADGLSRCLGSADATACCVDGSCGAPPAGTSSCRAFVPGAPERPGAGSAIDGQDDTSSCLGCEGIPLLSLLPLAVGLRLRRRKEGQKR